MAKKEKAAKQEEEIIQPNVEPEETAEKKPAKAKKTSFEVFNSLKTSVRVYSVEQHGQNAESLAEEYAKKIGGFVGQD